jgi:hypothetical protein
MLMSGNELISILVFTVFGLAGATILVEKRDQAPISHISSSIRWILKKIGLGFSVGMLECTVCCSFWMSGLFELVFWMRSGFAPVEPAWPFSGILAMAASFYIIDFLNTIDRRPQ